MQQGKKLKFKLSAEEDLVNHPSARYLVEKTIEHTIEFDGTEILIRKKFETDPSAGCTLLFRKYYAGLCSHAVRFVYSKELAEDIVGDIFLDFWKNRVFEKIHLSFGAYLFRTVRNRCLNYLNSSLNTPPKTDLNTIDEIQEAELSVEILYMDDLIQRINTAVDNLPPTCRRVFLLNRYEGKKQKEIALELGLSLRTIEAHIYKAMQSLKATILKKEEN